MRKDTGTRSTDMDLGYIDLNTANEQDLAAIPWIGHERAREIISHRPFMHMDDVRRLPGFTEDVMDQLVRGGAIVGDPSPARKAA
ncbi:MAG TPA: helix-hairpin-helix domain-containing protein [Clostridia bacterium]|nr:helix-hairpin-helix domain-containing protein [Clostridia bacterium]